MTAQLIDGNQLSKQLRTEVATRAQALKAKGVTPGLAVVLVGDNPASQVYVRNKVKACEDSGLHSVLEKYDATMTEADCWPVWKRSTTTRASTASWCSCPCLRTSMRKR
jgi:methylenetetrahydrofolate dehydrogenase (NADP+)/methenyltetrahydrofolate cyclohydrolase